MCYPWGWRPQNSFGTGRDHKLCKKWDFVRLQRWGQITLKNCFMPLFTIKPKSAFFSHGTICHTPRKQTDRWKCALIVMRQYYKHHWKTVLNLIKNSLINGAGTNSSKFTMILRFYRWKSHSVQNPKKNGFSRVSFLSYQKTRF